MIVFFLIYVIIKTINNNQMCFFSYKLLIIFNFNIQVDILFSVFQL